MYVYLGYACICVRMTAHLEDLSGGLDSLPLCRFANVLAFYIPSCTSFLLVKAVAFGGSLALLFLGGFMVYTRALW